MAKVTLERICLYENGQHVRYVYGSPVPFPLKRDFTKPEEHAATLKRHADDKAAAIARAASRAAQVQA